MPLYIVEHFVEGKEVGCQALNLLTYLKLGVLIILV